MLFRKDIEPRCAYCAHSCPLNDDELGCLKHGIVPPGHSCRAFTYDPLKRVPPRRAPLRTDKYSSEDFVL